MQTITTKYLPATNHKAERIAAVTSSKIRIYRPYPYQIEGSCAAAHSFIAKTLKNELGWTGRMVGHDIGTGYMFVFIDQDNPELIID